MHSSNQKGVDMPASDNDQNGIVDGSESSSYELYNNGNPITISTRRGRTFSNTTSNRWDVISGATTNTGFLVLRSRETRRRGTKYKLWSTNENGFINRRPPHWLSGQSLKEAGYENIFNLDLDLDGQIGNNPPEEPSPINDGSASFSIDGTPESGQTLSIIQTVDDPDGNGSINIQWQASNDDGTWSVVSSNTDFFITEELKGRQIRASVSYVDAEGFSESVLTSSISIPNLDIDDVGESTDNNKPLTIGESIDGELEQQGDRDWFAVSLQAEKNYEFSLNGISLTDPILTLRNKEGLEISINDDHGEGLNSLITHQATTSEIFFLDVGSYDNQLTGTYTINATEVDLDLEGFSPETGFGLVNAKLAFEKLSNTILAEAPQLGGNLWSLDNINAPDVWYGDGINKGATGSEVVVAVVDTGVDLDHSEFKDRLVSGYDFVENDSVADDGNGHGTHVAGTIAGANDGFGVTGVAHDAAIMPIRVLDDNGYGWTSDIIAGTRWAADNGADVINLSLGGGGFSQSMADTVAYASSLGAVVVMAAGNSGFASPDYPAAYAVNHGIAVGAVDQQDSMAGFSNRAGSSVINYVTAPGVDIFSAIPNDGYGNLSGTSMAAPHVAGVAALLKSYDQNISSDRIEDLLIGTASNSNQNNSSANKLDPLTGGQEKTTITLSTLNNFSEAQLDGRLIGSVNGRLKTRKSTVKDLEKTMREDGIINKIETIEGTRKNFVLLDLTNDAKQNNSQILEGWLRNDAFNYFEIDTQVSFA